MPSGTRPDINENARRELFEVGQQGTGTGRESEMKAIIRRLRRLEARFIPQESAMGEVSAAAARVDYLLIPRSIRVPIFRN